MVYHIEAIVNGKSEMLLLLTLISAYIYLYAKDTVLLVPVIWFS